MTRGGLLESPSPPPHRSVTPPPLRDTASLIGRTSFAPPPLLGHTFTSPRRRLLNRSHLLRASALGTSL
uniref:Uncharacterized protein n=1 Tax=Fagus sylvatica TaxID=28930 RepID=A0A2N9FP22_FAGSY